MVSEQKFMARICDSIALTLFLRNFSWAQIRQRGVGYHRTVGQWCRNRFNPLGTEVILGPLRCFDMS